MNVICLQDEAFYQLIEEVIDRIQQKQTPSKVKWVDTEEAMKLLNIKSKTSLQKLRDEGKIRFSQPQKRIILYDRDSIEAYLDEHAQNTF